MPLVSLESVRPEKKLLVYCARTRMSPEIFSEIRGLLALHLDWDYIVLEGAENSILPLIDRHLRAAGADLLPEALITRLQGAIRQNTIRCLILTAELVKILGLLASAKILAIPYKGPVVAAQAYGDVALREFEDLDIILCQRDLPQAHEILVSLGYRPKFPWILAAAAKKSFVPGEYNYRDLSRQIMVELHTERTLRHFPRVPDISRLAKNLVAVYLAGQEVRTFTPEVTLLMLCIHGSKDFWERLSWIVDASEMVQAYPALDWHEITARADSLEARRMLHTGLLLAHDLLGAPLPAEILAMLREDLAAESLAGEVIRRHLKKEYPRLDAAGRFHFRRRILTSQWAGFRYALRLSTVPSEDDWEMVRLPGWLSPLYLVLRPLRLLRKYGLGKKGEV
ncbi:MAG: nucleotidyltransferase domain-containing protein [Candidatus Acidiferrales bacterium]